MVDTSSNNDNLPEAPNDDFLKILENLLGAAGTGRYTEEYILPSGLKVTHHLSLATGLGAQHELYKYRSKFGEPPSWLRFCHPSHRIDLCRMALKTSTHLPKSTGHLSAYVEKVQKNQKCHEDYINKLKSDGTVTLDTALPVLVKSNKLQRILRKEFGSSKADMMISMMWKGVFSGDVGNELHDFLVDQINNESEIKWKGLILGSEDNEGDDYPVMIYGYHGIFRVWALEFDSVDFFLHFADAKTYVYREWGNVIDF